MSIISLMILSRCSPLFLMCSMNSICFSPSGPDLCVSKSWLKPSTELSGVLISWLTFARKLLLDLLATSASSFAIRISFSILFISVISVMRPMIPALLPLASL